jgi:ZIP family zinc transporter/zinc and cadmium transporter
LTAHPLGPPLAATLLAVLSGLAGIALSREQRARGLVPVSGLLLVAVALFGLMPELMRAIGWWQTLLFGASGYGFLALLDHRGYAVCPSCSHGGKFAGSLVVATAFHAFVDGWGMAATEGEATVGTAIAAAILLHKIPEGLALGTMLRASRPRATEAAGLLLIAEIPTLAGGLLGLHAQPGVWLYYPLAVAGGTFIFLGTHALQGVAHTAGARK